MEGQADIDERAHRLDVARMLCMIGKVPLTGLVFGIPLKYVKLEHQEIRSVAPQTKGESVRSCRNQSPPMALGEGGGNHSTYLWIDWRRRVLLWRLLCSCVVRMRIGKVGEAIVLGIVMVRRPVKRRGW